MIARALCSLLLLSLPFAPPAAGRAASPYDDGTWTSVTIVSPALVARASAPADEYFGPQRLSNLGMRNMIHFMTLEGTSPLALPQQMLNIDGITAGIAEWADKYPRDPWLPDSILKFAEFLQSKSQPFTDAAAASYLIFLQERYPQTPAGRDAVKILATYVQTPAFDMSKAALVAPIVHVNDLPYRPKPRR